MVVRLKGKFYVGFYVVFLLQEFFALNALRSEKFAAEE
jgi:hypothetical protein